MRAAPGPCTAGNGPSNSARGGPRPPGTLQGLRVLLVDVEPSQSAVAAQLQSPELQYAGECPGPCDRSL